MLPDGGLAECDPDSHSPCCNPYLKLCGYTEEYCSCVGCEDYKFVKEWKESRGQIKWRNDGKCGDKFSLPDSSPAQCDPNGANPCCDGQNCGYTKDHCTCDGCVDYQFNSLVVKENISNGKMKWRVDGKCGTNNPLPDGRPAQCEPDGIDPCCDSRNDGRCGNTEEFCSCWDCVDFRFETIDKKIDVKWRSDGKCGIQYPLPDNTPSQCNPSGERPCCSDFINGMCGNSTEYCSCITCTDYGRIHREWRESEGKQRWLYNRLCGSHNSLPNGDHAQCQPDGQFPCCSNSKFGFCSNVTEHCICEDCIDYSSRYKKWIESGLRRWRTDGKCGIDYPLPDGTPSECDPKGAKPCCYDDEVYKFWGICERSYPDEYNNCFRAPKIYGYYELGPAIILDYKLVEQVKKIGKKCTIARLASGFLKYMCFDEPNRKIYFKCTHSDVYYELYLWDHWDPYLHM